MQFFEGLDKAMENYSKAGGFLTAKAEGEVNTMTVSWGMTGWLWNKPVFMAFVRPQRYTRKLLDKADSFTVSIPFEGALAEELKICGTKSGADIDKSLVVSFVPARAVSSPVVGGCQAYYECRLIYADEIKGPALPEEIKQRNYADSDYHLIYVGEIAECYKKE